MTIFYDPTEGRSSTTIPKINDVGKSMSGLERATGADIAIVEDAYEIQSNFLVHPKSEEIARLSRQALKTSEVAAQVGVSIPVVKKVTITMAAIARGVLVQRKSGGDAIASIPKYHVILEKMLVWTNSPWLLITGDIKSDNSGRLIVNGRNSDFAYNAFQGALEAWQFRGGYLAWLDKDESVYDFLTRTEKKINERSPQKVIYMRAPQQYIVGAEDDDAWISTLATFKGIGSKMARELAETFGTLAAALCFLSDETALQWKNKPDGFGPITLQHARNRLGLTKGQRLQIAYDKDVE